MSTVIDTCCLVSVFNPRSADHAQFAPILQWVALGKGRMIYGGTKYKTELSRVVSSLPLITELHRAGRVKLVDDRKIDDLSLQLKKKIPVKKFNDEHIAAIVICSSCRVVCTKDVNAISYLKNVALFRSFRVKRPKIYRSLRNASLCCDKNLI